jgi:post-segregation antitoxin (ccd killing protein)
LLEGRLLRVYLAVTTMSYVTVSTKVRRSLLEKARKLGINVSEVLRRALEEVRKREAERAVRVMDEISQRIELDVEAKDLIRKLRDER